MHKSLRNILLIVIDTARAKSFYNLGNRGEMTAALDTLGREGMYFTRCISPASWTNPSHASLFTGKYPSEHGTHGKNIFFNHQNNLASEFRLAGFKTFGISSNELVSSLTGFDQGFDRFADPWTPFRQKPLKPEPFDTPNNQGIKRSFIDKLLFLLSKGGINTHFNKWFGVYQNAIYSTDRAIRFVKHIFGSVKDPKFVFVNIMQPHERYNPPRRYLRSLGHHSGKIQWPDSLGYYASTTKIDEYTWKILHTLYEAEILCAYERIGGLLEWMENKRLLENTTVVITSDHGEHIGEHEHFTHYFSLYNEVLHVPLIIYHPDYRGIGKRTDLVQTHDLYRTLIEMELGISDKFNDMDSEYTTVNLLTGKRRMAIAQLIYPLWIKGVMRRNPAIREETFDLASRQFVIFQYNKERLEKIWWDSRKGITAYDMENDWDEIYPLKLNPTQQKQINDIVADTALQMNFSLYDDNEVDISSEVIKHLSALGYA